jgi:hypothetical protein
LVQVQPLLVQEQVLEQPLQAQVLVLAQPLLVQVLEQQLLVRLQRLALEQQQQGR